MATGQVQFVHRSVAWNPDSQRAAEAAECADEQGAFWEYSDLLFANRARLPAAVAFGKPYLEAYAAALNLDGGAFFACLDSDRYASAVRASTGAAEAAGVRATPTFLINGEMVEGNLPFESFQTMIERFLGEA